MTTTSIHRLNGDRHLSHAGKLAYFALNWLNNRLPEWFVDPHMTIRDFRCPNLAASMSQLGAGTSPSRRLSDLFWITLPWPEIQEELDAIRVLDVGCGEGGYASRLMTWSGDRIVSYLGADVRAHERWRALEQDDPRIRFIETDAGALMRSAPEGTNLIVSQSTIEHIDADLEFFEGVRDYVARRGHGTLQIHLCPSPACLKLYLLHGVRQYTPRTLSKITRLFEDGYAVVYRLGGRESNRIHYRFITAPLMSQRTGNLRLARAAEYEAAVLAAIERDMTRPQPSPAFYALVVHSRPRARVF